MEHTDDVPCPLPDCGEPLAVVWVGTYTLSPSDLEGNDPPTFSDAHATTWQIVCHRGHVLLLPPDTGEDNYDFESGDLDHVRDLWSQPQPPSGRTLMTTQHSVPPPALVVVVTGHSDDLIELDGAISEEFSPPYGDEPRVNYLAFSDGTVLSVEYSSGGIWRIAPATHWGTAKIEITPAGPGEGTDKATLTGDLRWVVFGSEFAQPRWVVQAEPGSPRSEYEDSVRDCYHQ
jgi:hypothetical protein